MRNLKKLLALVLAMVMAFSLMLSASAASGDFDKYGDKDEITDTFKEAVQVLSGLDVLKGDGPDDAKTFRPGDTLTRAEAAVIVYRVATGDVTDNQTALYADYNHFADVSKDDWFAGYVGFCQNGGYIKGTTPTTFSPYLKVTGYELLAMLLRVVGYGKNNEFTGSAWQVNTAALAESLHITDTVKEANFSSTLNMAARRDVVAELTFQTMTIVPTVTYSSSLQYSDRDSVLGSSTYKNPTLGQKIFGLFMDDTVDAVDDWGRPGYYWVKDGVHATTGTSPNVTRLYDVSTGLPIYDYKSGNASTASNASKLIATIKDDPIVVYNTAKTECDIIHENTEWSGDKSKTVSSRYLNGVKDTATKLTPGQANPTDSNEDNNTIEALGTQVVLGAQGRIMEIYDMSLGGKRVSTANGEKDTRIVEIDTWLAQVDRVTAAGTDRNGHPTKATVDLTVFPAEDDEATYARTHDKADTDHEARTVATNHEVWDFDKVEAEGFSVGDYVLVYINQDMSTSDALVHDARYNYSNKYSINGIDVVNADETSNLKKAEIKAGGYVRSWTDTTVTSPNPDTTVIGTTTYNDAAKFCCNWRVKNIPWSVAVDRYGNAIGLVNFTQYLVIEKLEWKHGSAFDDDYALADVLLASGEKVPGVKISMVNNRKLVNTLDDLGVLARWDDPNYTLVGTVSDHYSNNREYYYHIFSYAVSEDGTYSLGTDLGYNVDDDLNPVHTNAVANVTTEDLDAPVTVTRGEATIYGGDATNRNSYVATDNTVFAVLNADGYTYTTYVGKNNVPSMTAAQACVQVGEDGYAAFVVLSGISLESDTFLGYFTDATADTGKYIGSDYVDGFIVYPLGETSERVVYSDDPATDLAAVTKTGFYEVSVNANGKITTPVTLATDNDDELAVDSSGWLWGDADDEASGYNGFLRAAITKAASGNSVMYGDYTTATKDATKYNGYRLGSTSAWVDLNITADTKIVVINKQDVNGTMNGTTYLTPGDITDITDDAIGYVACSTRIATSGAKIRNANVIYVVKLPNAAKLADKVAGWTIDIGNVRLVNPTDKVIWERVDGTNADAYNHAKANTLKVSRSTLRPSGGNNMYQLAWNEGGDASYFLGAYNSSSLLPTKAQLDSLYDDNTQAGLVGSVSELSLSVGDYLVFATDSGADHTEGVSTVDTIRYLVIEIIE